jgi:signal transduction histidine kinase
LALLVALASLCAGGGWHPVAATIEVDPLPSRRVLAIFPSDHHDPIATLLDQGLRDGLQEASGRDTPTEVYSEFLDMARLPEPALQQAQLSWLRRKYAERPPDAVVAFGTSTARALDALEQPLFPDAVAIFAALDPLLFPDLTLPPDADTIWVRYDVGATLDAALRLQPAARRVLLVAGLGELDRAMLTHARSEVAPYAERVSIEESTNLSLDNLVRYVAALPPETVVLFLAVNRDGAGTPLPVGEALRRVVAASGAPIYTNTETSVGTGVVGGAVTSYTTLGATAARAVLRRLGSPHAPADSSVTAMAPTLVFDWRQVRRWSLREDRLPPGSELRFRPPSLWEQYRRYAAGAVLLFIAQTVLVAILLLERRHRRRAQVALTERQADLERVNDALRGRTREVEARNAQVRTLAGKLIAAQEQERAHIARELHDEVGQSLTIVRMSLDTLRSQDDTGPLPSAIDETLALVDRTLDEVRDLSLLLRPSLLDHLGLEAALRWLVTSQAQRAGYHATFSVDHLRPPPSQDLAITCYRVAQEALTNVARHASACTVTVELRIADGSLRLTVQDDGEGFDLASMQHRARHGGSMGLLGLEERARLVDGDLAIESAPGAGTTVTLRVPYPAVEQPGQDAMWDSSCLPAMAGPSDD